MGKLETPQKNSHHNMKSPLGMLSDESSQGEEEDGEEGEGAEAGVRKQEKKLEKKVEKKPRAPLDAGVSEFKRMSEERRRMRRLRHDLERVRLLCELIRLAARLDMFLFLFFCSYSCSPDVT